MRVRPPLLLLASLLAACSVPTPPRVEVPASGQLVLEGVTVVDVTDGGLQRDMSVLMDEGVILRITPSASTKAPGARVVDARGKFVVPGFNDMHVHVLGSELTTAQLSLMLAHGVTGIRQMSGSPELLEQRRRHTLPLGKDAPALLAMPGTLIMPFSVSKPSEAAAEVHRQKEEGADFIKMALGSPAIFFATLEAAKHEGLPMVGHLQEGVDAAEASRRGFRSVEHLGPGDSIWIACSREEEPLRTEAAAHTPRVGPPFKIPYLDKLLAGKLRKLLINPSAFAKPTDVARLQRALDTHGEAKCKKYAAQVAADGTWQTPTLVRIRNQELADAPEYAADPALRTMTPRAVAAWREVTQTFLELPQVTRATYRSLYARQLALTKLLDDAGVLMMTGTDGGDGAIPGLTLHQELDQLGAAGLPPLHILQMTTLRPAQFLGNQASRGTVAPGKLADLVLLDANPLADAQNLHRIWGVVRAGFYHPRSELDAWVARVEANRGVLH